MTNPVGPSVIVDVKPLGIGNALLAPNSVTTDKVADGTLVNADVAATAGIAESKLALSFPTHSNANDPSAGQKAALAGTAGTPGEGNRYVTAADARLADARTPQGVASGDLSGTYPGPVVDGLQGWPVSGTAPTNGQILGWNGSAWAPTTASGGGDSPCSTNGANVYRDGGNVGERTSPMRS